MLDLLSQSPWLFLAAILAIVVALSVHEYSHALTAYFLGDRTSQYMGRLTLNPLAHIDPLGLLLLIFVGFGWGKPVPFNIYNLRNNRWGQALIAVFGPLSNFLLAGAAYVLGNFLINASLLSFDNLLAQFLFRLIQINFVLGVFNLIPIPPLDGSKVLFSFLPEKFSPWIEYFETQGPWILLLLLIVDNFFGIHFLSGFLQFAWNFAVAFFS